MAPLSPYPWVHDPQVELLVQVRQMELVVQVQVLLMRMSPSEQLKQVPTESQSLQKGIWASHVVLHEEGELHW